MKTLKNFIIEQSQVNEEFTEKTITFNFAELENAEETLDSLKDNEYCDVEEDKLTVTITAENVEKLNGVKETLKKYSEKLHSSTRRSSDEIYAQKIKKFASKVDEFDRTLEEINNKEEE